MAIPGLSDWQQQILQGIQAPTTPENLRFLNAWQRGEGGTAANNPFNTTWKMPGATPYNTNNGFPVLSYATPQAGIQATIDTLTNGHYGNILTALRSGTDAMAAARALAASPWGTGALVMKILGGSGAATPAAGGSVPVSAPAVPVRTLASAAPPAIGLPNLTGALLGSLGKSPGAQLSAIMGSIAALPRATPLGAQFAQSGIETPSMPSPPSGPPLSAPGPPLSPGSIGKWAVLSSSADRPGVHTNEPVLDIVARIARTYGKPLTIGTGTNHNQYVVGTHRESAHWQGNAADIPASGDALTRLGRAALVTAGMSQTEAAKQKGGLFNIGGYQIIFNSMIGGNHYNHLHVGIRS